MFKPEESALAVARTDGVAGNSRLTAALGCVAIGPARSRGRDRVSFIVWFALMAIHVLGHILELPGPAFADWRRRGPRLTGAGLRLAAIAFALAIGVGLAVLSFSAAGSWG
ncbi:MAG TPA: hypothetical protein VF245_02575 [Solirubrobacterales bacterium]